MFRSLRAKLLLSHLGLVLLSMVILGAYLVQNMDWFYLDATRARARDDSSIFVERIAPLLASGDREAVKKYLADMGNNVEARVMVTDADGMIVGTTEPEESQFLGRPGVGRGIPHLVRNRIERVIQRPSDPSADVVYIATPIDYGDKQVGTLRLSYQLRDLDLQVEKLTYIILVGLGAATAVGVIVSLVLSQSLSAPARKLVAAIRAVSSGELSYRMNPRGRDEIRDAARAFDGLADRLQNLEGGRQRLLGDVSHDIHSSITGVNMAVEALSRGAIDDPAMRAILLDGLASHGHRLHRLADDLLEAARIEAGRLRVECEPLQPQDVMRAVAAEFTAEAAQQAVRISLLEDGNLPPVQADRHRISQALGNLVENAIRHTPMGGTIYISGERSGNECVISVRDEGPGIPEQEQANLFDRFKRFESERPGRLGLGLAIAKALVEAQGGRIEVASAPERGAIFRVMLPALENGEDCACEDLVAIPVVDVASKL